MPADDSNGGQRRTHVLTQVIIVPPSEIQGEDGDDASWFYKLAAMSDECAGMDDHQLLWCVIKAGIWRRPINSVADMVLQELANRLYPEYDATNVKWTEYGWMTPEGEIRYIDD